MREGRERERRKGERPTAILKATSFIGCPNGARNPYKYEVIIYLLEKLVRLHL